MHALYLLSTMFLILAGVEWVRGGSKLGFALILLAAADVAMFVQWSVTIYCGKDPSCLVFRDYTGQIALSNAAPVSVALIAILLRRTRRPAALSRASSLATLGVLLLALAIPVGVLIEALQADIQSD